MVASSAAAACCSAWAWACEPANSARSLACVSARSIFSYVDTTEEVAKQPVGPRLDKVRDGNKGERGKVLSEKENLEPWLARLREQFPPETPLDEEE